MKATAPRSLEAELGTVTCVCERCLGIARARILATDMQVAYEKVCPIHGVHRTVVSNDPEYFMRCHSLQSANPGGSNMTRSTRSSRVTNVLQSSSAMPILEVVQGCNAKCPTCSAASLPGQAGMLSLSEVNVILGSFTEATPQHDLLMISGGEPTLHPQIMDVLKAARAHGIARVMLITNGIRLASDAQFVSKLAELGSWLEIYLQFDSLSENVLRVLRGEDLRDVRNRAIENLEHAKIATTLVSVVKKGLNDHEIREVIEVGLAHKCIRGVTFQPLRAVGRTVGFDPTTEWTTLSEVRRNVLASGHFSGNDLQPHPCNPERICIGYLSRESGRSITNEVLSLTRSDPALHDGLSTKSVRHSMFFSPLFEQPGFAYEDVFRVCVVSYADRFDFTFEGAARSCIHFLQANGSLVPLENHYLFPRNESSPEQTLVNLALPKQGPPQLGEVHDTTGILVGTRSSTIA